MIRLAVGPRTRSTRRSTAASILLGIVIGFAPMTASAKPLVPILSFLQHWDHHWYAWLPGDPVYEAVEVMASERGAQEPLVWVFFTERAPPKNQVNYYNDAAVAAASKAAGRVAHVAPLHFAMTGRDGAPRGVTVGFDDAQSRSVSIEIGVDDGATLTTAGLTDQIGHSSARTFLIFFREMAARTSAARVIVAGVDLTKPQPGVDHAVPFVAAYSKNIYVGGFAFYGATVSFGDATSSPSGPVIGFRQISASNDYESSDGQRLVTAADGALKAYQRFDWSRAHRLEVRFEPPLPSVERLTASEAASRVSVSLDGFSNLLSGEVTAHRSDNTVMLDWRFEAPAWARMSGLRATATVEGDAVTQIALKPLN